MNRYARIIGTGSYLPPRRLSNADLVAQLASDGVESSDEWIVERTGIRARHFADEGVFSSDLAFEACKNALQAAGKRPQDIDLIIVATSTPDMVFPSTACILQHKLAQLDADAAGIAGAPAFDVQAVCAGFIYAMSVADAMIRAGNAAVLWWWVPRCFPVCSISKIAPPACCLAMARAQWCWKPQKILAFWPPISMPMASMWACCASPVMCKTAKFWATQY